MKKRHFTGAAIFVLSVWVLYELAVRIGVLSFLFYPDDEAIRQAVLLDIEESGIDGVQIVELSSHEGKAVIDLLYDGFEISTWTNAYNTFSTNEPGFSMPVIDGIGVKCWNEDFPNAIFTPNFNDLVSITSGEDPGSIASVLLHLEEIQARLAWITASQEPVAIHDDLRCRASRRQSS